MTSTWRNLRHNTCISPNPTPTGRSGRDLRHALLDSLFHVLLRRIELLLEQLDLAIEAVRIRAGRVGIARCGLELGDLALGLLEVSLKYGYLAVQTGDFVVPLEEELLELLDFGLRDIAALGRSVGFDTEGLEFLIPDKSVSAYISERQDYCVPP